MLMLACFIIIGLFMHYYRMLMFYMLVGRRSFGLPGGLPGSECRGSPAGSPATLSAGLPCGCPGRPSWDSRSCILLDGDLMFKKRK